MNMTSEERTNPHHLISMDMIPEREYLLSEAIRLTKLGIWELTLATNTLRWSHETYRCYGQSPETFTPTRESFLQLVHPDDRAAMHHSAEAMLRDKASHNKEFRVILPDHSVRYLRGSGELLSDSHGNPVRLLGTVVDITDSKLAEKRIAHLNRVYALLSKINHLIVHMDNQEGLFEVGCRIAAEQGEYALVRICLADEESGIMKPVAQYSAIREVAEHVECRTIEALTEEHPIGQKIRAGKAVCINDLRLEMNVHTCAECAIRSHCLSAALYPLTVGGKIRGVISFYSDQPDFFDAEELRLLNEVSEDIGFAIESHQKEAGRVRAETELKLKSEELERYFSTNLDLLCIADKEGYFLRLNPEWERTFGYPLAEMIGKRSLDFIHPDDIESSLSKLVQTSRGNELKSFVNRLRHRDGSYRWLEWRAYVEGNQIYATARNITERRRRERALQESEKRYRTLFDGMMDGVYRSTHDGKFVDGNHAMVTMFGYESREEMLKIDIKKDLYFAPEDRQSLFMDVGEEKVEVFRMRRKDGSEIWVEDHGRYVHDDRGHVIFHEGVLRDVTARKRADEALAESESRLRTILQSEPECVKVLDRDGVIHDINPAGLQMIEAESLDQVKGLAVQTLTAEEYRVDFERLIERVFNGETVQLEFKIIGLKGTHRWVDTHAVPLKDQSGKIVSLLGLTRDISERKHAEQSLRNSEARVRSLIDNARDVIFTIDLKGVLTSLNSWFTKITGWNMEEWIGKSFTDLIHQDDLGEARRRFANTIQGGMLPPYELRIRAKDGSYIFGEITTTPDVVDGNIIGILGIARDITERRRIEQDMRQIQKMESIGTLAGGIAHDFNNILGIIMGYTSILERVAKEPARVLQVIEPIAKATERGAGLVKQLLTFARKSETVFEPVALKQVIDELVKMFKATFPKTIALNTMVGESLPKIYGDPTQVHQALLNLCVNARDAMPSGGKLTISGSSISGDALKAQFPESSAPTYIKISVSDTGSGMDDATRRRIFEPFFTTKEKGKGTGLGLAVVYGVTKSHRGFISVQSTPGKGTSFDLYFPAHQVGSEAAASGNTSDPKVPGGTETILLVEDEDLLRTLIRTILEKKGYRVLTASDGIEAIECYKNFSAEIALVLTDVGMPRMDGMNAYAQLKELNPKLKCVFASGYLDAASRMHIIETEHQYFIEKPYSPDDLLMKIRFAIDKK